MAEFAINSTLNVSTGKAPFTIVYGEENAVRVPIDQMLLNRAHDVPAASDVARQTAELVREVQLQMHSAQQKQKL